MALNPRAQRPAWFSELLADYQAGMANVFLIHGHVHDYVDSPSVNRTVREYLEEALNKRYVLTTFAPDEGIGFPSPSPLLAQEARAYVDQVLGRNTPPAGAASGGFDPIAALRAAGGPGGFTGGSDEEPLPSDAPTAIGLLVDFLRQASTSDQNVPLAVNAVEQVTQVTDPASGATRTEVEVAYEVVKNEKGQAVPRWSGALVERLDLICPPDDKSRIGPADRALLSLLHRAGTDKAINRRNNLLILLAPSLEEVHPDLRLAASGIRAIEVPPPDYDQRLAFIARATAEETDDQGVVTRAAIQCDGVNLTDLAKQTAGLNRRHIEDLVLRAAQSGGVITREMVKARKKEQISSEYAEVLEILEPDVTFADVGGHDAVKAWLQEEVIDAMRDPDPESQDDVPMGILFAGPSGTGKTYLARALAKESGYNCVSMAPDNIRGQYVGESEKKLRKAIQGVKTMAPVILFIDEIDQKLRRTSGGGGGGESVEGNIFGKMLEFLSDDSHRGSILLVAATNEPQAIDPALQRPGRIDAKIPLLPPDTAEERRDALRALAGRYGLLGATDAELLAVGQQTNLWTQAELQALVVKTRAYLRRTRRKEAAEGTDPITVGQAFTAVLKRMRPSTKGIERHIKLAVQASDDAELVPLRWRHLVGTLVADPPAAAPSAVPERQPAGRVAVAADGFGLGDLGDLD